VEIPSSLCPSPSTGVTAAAETVLERLGSLGNFIGQDVLVINPDTKQVDEVQYPFDTDMILLDVRGGREVIEGSGIERPGELLVVGHEGKIVVLSELDDKPAVQDHKDLYEKVERLRSAEPGKIPGTGNPIIGSGDDVFK